MVRSSALPLCIIYDILFLAEQPQNFSKGANITYFEGGARAEKTQFLVRTFQKRHKNAFLACFLKKLPAAAQNVFDRIRPL